MIFCLSQLLADGKVELCPAALQVRENPVKSIAPVDPKKSEGRHKDPRAEAS